MAAEIALLPLIQLGLKVGSGLLDLASGRRHEDKNDYDVFFEKVSSQVEQVIHQEKISIIEKLESDKLELLVSRIKNLATLVHLQKRNEALEYAMTLKESVDYAQNRLKEGKNEWLGPLLTGQAVYAGALMFADVEAKRIVGELDELMLHTRVSILETYKESFLRRKDTPWLDIHAFISGNSQSLLDDLSSSQQNPSIKNTPPLKNAEDTTSEELDEKTREDSELYCKVCSKKTVHSGFLGLKRCEICGSFN